MFSFYSSYCCSILILHWINKRTHTPMVTSWNVFTFTAFALPFIRGLQIYNDQNQNLIYFFRPPAKAAKSQGAPIKNGKHLSNTKYENGKYIYLQTKKCDFKMLNKQRKHWWVEVKDIKMLQLHPSLLHDDILWKWIIRIYYMKWAVKRGNLL